MLISLDNNYKLLNKIRFRNKNLIFGEKCNNDYKSITFNKTFSLGKKFFLVFLLILAVCCLLSCSGVSAATTHTVSGNKYSDINSTISSADSGDTINLGNKTYTEDGDYIHIHDKNLIIQGKSDSQRATLKGQGVIGGFYIRSGCTVTLRYINFVDAASQTGHAVSTNGTLILENCTFTNCSGDSGGAVYLHNNSFDSMIKDCNFIDNKANDRNLNNYADGGAIVVMQKILK
jgi:hypothetical protein